MFEGAREVARVDIYTRPETLHFGFSTDDLHRGFYKTLRDQAGMISDKKVDLNHWHSAQQRTINVTDFGKSIAGTLSPSPALTSSLFGLQMVESGDRIIFRVNPM